MKNRIGIVTSVIVYLLILVAVGPLDVCTHGFYPNEVDIAQIADADILGTINVDDKGSKIVFSPQEKHFAGVELFLVNHFPENGGVMTMLIYDSEGIQIDKVEIDLSKVKDSIWYKTYTNANLRKGEQYTAIFSISGTDVSPCFLLVNQDYLGNEIISGDILISSAYAESTFSFQEKVLLFILMSAILGKIIICLVSNEKYRRILNYVVLYIVLVAGMAWNFMYNSFDNQNTEFSDFQSDSEALVSGTIFAERDGIYFREDTEQGYGLGKYYDLKGWLGSYGLSYCTDDNWLYGYSKTLPAIMVNSNQITKEIAVAGHYIQFSNGEEYQITETTANGANIVINLNSGRPLSQARNGSLDEAAFFDAEHNPLKKSLITAYASQYGLQGKVFRHIARHMSEKETISNLNLICALATASVFAIIVLLLVVKYNPLFAGCFYITFALSPWTVNFARNLYWVEFTWFIPMAVGLVCSLKIQSVKWKIGCYVAAFFSIAGKSLCGYEYISAVMMGLVSFMVIDFLTSLVKKDNQKTWLLFKSIFILGSVALLGFMVAICIHAPLKSGGSIAEGITKIIENDVLKRTNGGDLNDFAPVYWPSMNASIWEVYSKYFHFSTEIIAGVEGNLFPLLCLVPLVIFIYEFKDDKKDYQSLFMYVFFFLTSISWFCLAKSHSYIHTHMNYVMWYFGFVQVCIYVIVSAIVNAMKTNKEKDNNTYQIQVREIESKGKQGEK